MTPEEINYVFSLLDVAVSVGILVLLAVAFVRGDIVSSKVLRMIVAATVTETLEEIEKTKS